MALVFVLTTTGRGGGNRPAPLPVANAGLLPACGRGTIGYPAGACRGGIGGAAGIEPNVIVPAPPPNGLAGLCRTGAGAKMVGPPNGDADGDSPRSSFIDFRGGFLTCANGSLTAPPAVAPAAGLTLLIGATGCNGAAARLLAPNKLSILHRVENPASSVKTG